MSPGGFSVAAVVKWGAIGGVAGLTLGAGTSFLKALSHQAPSPSHLPLEYFAGRFLTVLAASSLAFGIIHVELDLLRWLVRRWRHGSAPGAIAGRGAARFGRAWPLGSK